MATISAGTPTIILCSGAWHTEAHITPVVPYFEKAGFKIIPLPLTTAGNKEATAESSVEAVINAINLEFRAGRSAAIILHSAAGPIGLAAAHDVLKSQPDAKDKLIIMMLGSFLDYGPITQRLIENGNARFGDEPGTIVAANAKEGFFNDMSDEDAKPFIDGLVIQGMAGAPDERSDIWKQCQVWCICTEKDTCVPLDWQIKMAEENSMHIARIDTGHDPFISQPAKFVEVVSDALSR